MTRSLLALAAAVLALAAEPAAAAAPPRPIALEIGAATSAPVDPVATEAAVTDVSAAVPTVAATPPVEATSPVPEPATGSESGAVEQAPEPENVVVDPAAEATPPAGAASPEPEPAAGGESGAVELAPEPETVEADLAAVPPDQNESETETDPSAPDPGAEGESQPEGPAEPEAEASPQIDSSEAATAAVEPAIERAEVSPPSASQSVEDRAELDTSSASAPVARGGETTTEAPTVASSAALVARGVGAEASDPSALPAMSKTSELAGELPRSAVAGPIGGDATADRVLVPIGANVAATATPDRVLAPIRPLVDWSAPEGPCSPGEAQIDPSGAVAAARFVTLKTAARTSGGTSVSVRTSVPITAATVVVSHPVAAGGAKSAEKPTSTVRPERLSARPDTAPALIRKRADLEPAARATASSAGVEPNPPPWLLGLFALMLAGLSLPIMVSAKRAWVRHHPHALPPGPPAHKSRAVPERPGGIRYRE